MTYLDAIILGVIEGLTEFLPVSSTGHLILASSALGIGGDFLKSFEIIIQLGAIFAVVLLYYKILLKNFNLVKKVIWAFIPTAVIGLIFYKIVKTYFLGNNYIVLGALFLGGIAIIIFDKWEKKKEELSIESNINSITYKQAFYVGVWQALAIIPGVSRSATTIIGGRSLGITRSSIVEFSFLLAIPTIAAASALDILKNYETILSGNLGLLAVGFIVSFVVAIFAIKGFLKFVKTRSFAFFGWYRIVIAIIAFFFLV